MEISEIYNVIYLMIDSSLQNYKEFLCVICKKICLVPLYFEKCFHNFCFLCYSKDVFGKNIDCPACGRKILSTSFAYRKYSLEAAIEKKLDNDALQALKVLERKVSEIEDKMNSEILIRRNANFSIEIDSQLPIYSMVWSQNFEKLFKERYSQLDDEEKIEQLKALGLSKEVIRESDEEIIDLIMDRLSIDQSRMSLIEKKKMLENLIR